MFFLFIFSVGSVWPMQYLQQNREEVAASNLTSTLLPTAECLKFSILNLSLDNTVIAKSQRRSQPSHTRTHTSPAGRLRCRRHKIKTNKSGPAVVDYYVTHTHTHDMTSVAGKTMKIQPQAQSAAMPPSLPFFLPLNFT